MAPALDLQRLEAELEKNHRGLHELLAEVRGGLTAWRRDEKTHRDLLATALARLRSFLEDHFTEEERSPLFGEVASSFPRFTESLTRLRGEHQVLVVEIRALEKALEEGPARHGDLAFRARALVSTLLRHEAEETEILHRALVEDLGR